MDDRSTSDWVTYCAGLLNKKLEDRLPPVWVEHWLLGGQHTLVVYTEDPVFEVPQEYMKVPVVRGVPRGPDGVAPTVERR